MHSNVILALEEGKIQFKTYQHNSFTREINHPLDFANALGYPIQRITKTVFIRSINKDKYALAVCSADKKLNFQLLAAQLGCKKAEVASKEELQKLVGYPPTGVSPIGVSKVPVIIDKNLLSFQTILIGSGVAGEEIEIAPSDLQTLTEASVLEITM